MINNIWILIGKKLSGEATAEELLELEELLRQGAADQYPLDLLEDMWRAENQALPAEKLASKWDAFEAKLDIADNMAVEEATQPESTDQPKSKSGIIRFLKIISLVIAACFAVVFVVINKKDVANNSKANEIMAPPNGISKIQLPDGTRVWLNSGSKLVYGATYGAGQRSVSLLGEALFDVVKDPQHPFIVTTPTISIKVLGTKFNVRAYNGDKTSETSLIRGRIELTVLKTPEKKIILQALDKLVIHNELPPATGSAAEPKSVITEEVPLMALSRVHMAKKDTLPSEALWVENKLAFDAEDFESLAGKLERRYNVTIVFKNEELKKLRFTGRFKNETIGRALKALQTTTYFHYKTDNNQILVY
ncbi:FecR family protein [Mucilaginibacter sp. FT3.2]|uniref:FecR family protein n=1 Tax=Mucilaginibacter sp. FT3.2 TaxID=2723090 RepID=UPI0016162AE3|nr:FecR family protein [Mucilaginibacter sp. FT3.2]MBB6231147.1 ferric-dicitrate binding protein FerR (iron transport regulator) [Mucilaginibacter sp. FT3.2]